MKSISPIGGCHNNCAPRFDNRGARRPSVFLTLERAPGGKVPRNGRSFGPALARSAMGQKLKCAERGVFVGRH
jgi:hypothetical protein